MSPEHVIIAASASNLANAVELLVRHFEGVENAATGADRGTPLHKAAQSGSHNVVEVLLTSPTIEVSKRDWLYRTPLHEAAQKGHHKVVEMMLAVPTIEVNKGD